MKKIKEKLIKSKDYIVYNDDKPEIVRFGMVTLGIVAFVGVVYLFTKYVINDGDINIVVFDSVEGQVNYNVASIGTMMGKEDDEYYVYIYSGSDEINLISYQVIASLYTSQVSDDILPVYYVDLDNKFNENYIATDERPENTDAKTVDEISLGDLTLIKVKDGEIIKYLNTIEDIQEELAVMN